MRLDAGHTRDCLNAGYLSRLISHSPPVSCCRASSLRGEMPHRGRGAWLLTARRLKSFKCFVIGAVVVNLVLLLSLAWRTIPRTSRSAGLSAGLQDNSIFSDIDEVQTNLDAGRVKQQGQINVGLIGAPGVLEGKLDFHAVGPDIAGGVHKTACSYRTAVYMNNRHMELNQAPFAEYAKSMTCLEDGDIAVFEDRFVRFNNIILDSARITSARKGGEQIEEVWNQMEDEEYFKLDSGFFKASCIEKPMLRFSNVDHLNEWARVLECYSSNLTDITKLQSFPGTTLAIQRYEYVNLYHTMTDFYNAFVLMLIFGVPPSKLNILAVDAHPEGTLDPVWEVLFGKFVRAGRLQQPVLFEHLVWGLLGYFSPLNEHERSTVPYLSEFREFFLSRHNISTEHTLDCTKLNVLLIWRRDYVAHPRNPRGSVVRKFENEEEMVQEVKDTLGSGSNVKGVQLDALPMIVQLQTIAKTDILIGMHGAGLSHIMFLPATSGVIEFKPEYSNPALQHFKSMARWRNLPYTIWHNLDPTNERPLHKTYIPADVMKKTVHTIFQEICASEH